MHEIQLDILKRITLKPHARYIDLKSRDVDGNLFMYHLNQLMQDGLIAKNEDKKYFLTEAGKKEVSLLSTNSGEIRKQPQILVMIYCAGTEGKLLFYKWDREPNTGLVSLPHGKMHFGKSPFKMAASELQEKCNLSGELKFRGDIYLTVWSNKQIFNQYLCHIFEASNVAGVLKSNSTNGECFWGEIDNYSEREIWPGTWEILEIINKSNTDRPFLAEAESVL